MAPAFSKEAILQGSIDHLCLVCESYLRSERDVCLHVSTPAHRQNLDSTDYVEKYRNDRVRKVKTWYFCEYCNVLVSTVTAVRLHIKELEHKENKTSQMRERVGDVIVSGNIAISEEAWHGFIDVNTCVICDVEYEDQDVHKNESSHLINLIQSKADDNDIYRTIDESSFHCMICNELVTEITAHLDITKHKNLLQDCIRTTRLNKENEKCNENLQHEVSGNEISIEDKDNIGKILNTKLIYITHDLDGKTFCNLCNCNVDPSQVQIHIDSLQHKTVLQKKDGKKFNAYNENLHDVLESVTKFKMDNIHINFESHTAVCTKCSVNIELNAKVIESHIKDHKNNVQGNENKTAPVFEVTENNSREKENKEKLETKPREKIEEADFKDDVQKKAEELGLTYDSSNNKVHCQACNKRIPSSIKNIVEHVNGEMHKKKLSLWNTSKMLKSNKTTMRRNVKTCNYQRVPIVHFIRSVGTFNRFHQDIVVNDKYCINYHSFTYLTKLKEGQFRCQVCEVNMRKRDIKDHVKLGKHLRALLEVPVVIYTESEFVREIRSEIFQCGFCNIIDTWEGIESHMKSTVHKRNKQNANYRLTHYLLGTGEDDVEHELINPMHVMFSLHEQFC